MSGELIKESQIANWYSGQCIFITGVSGFLGKVLLEKLLRSCTDIKNIYVLLRSKKGVLAEDRLATQLKDPLYDTVRKANPECFKKIIIVTGDIMEHNLGISREDRQILAENVSVVYHCAASVKFTEPIQVAFSMNVVGTKQVINLALEMKNLKVFVHVSTAFSNCNLRDVEEKLYDPPIESDKLIQIIKLLDNDTLNYITPKLLKDWPNTYTFTKALAEHLVNSHTESGQLPAVIIRPAIVTATWQEPVPGWMLNTLGPTGMIIGAGKGIVRAFLTHTSISANFVPVDFVVNLIIASAWYTSNNSLNTTLIYNCSTDMINPTNITKMTEEFLKLFEVYPFENTFWYPGVTYFKQRLPFVIYSLIIRTIPAYIFDLFLFLTGKRTFAVNLNTKIDNYLESYNYFTTRQWNFHSENIPKLLDTISETDRKVFNFDVKTMVWKKYYENYMIGIKKYLLKENIDELSKGREHYKRLKITYFVLMTLLFIVFIYMIFKVFCHIL